MDFVLDGYARYNAGERRPELWFWHPLDAQHANAVSDEECP
jgi:hypothetical protein